VKLRCTVREDAKLQSLRESFLGIRCGGRESEVKNWDYHRRVGTHKLIIFLYRAPFTERCLSADVCDESEKRMFDECCCVSV
jgi:hypothetical protein